MNTYDMRGFEAETKQVDPEILSLNQYSVYEALATPKTTLALYILLEEIMPKSSVRRILYTLKYKGLVEKTGNRRHEWRSIPFGT